MRRIKRAPSLVLVLLAALSVHAARASDSEAMTNVLKRYARIHADLIGESHGQIKDDATSLYNAAGGVKDEKLSSEIRSAAKRMISDSSVGMGHPSASDAIKDFKALSVPIVAWVQKNKPEGWTVIHCSMADASWVQKKDQPVQNPYGDKDMRTCGEKVSFGGNS